MNCMPIQEHQNSSNWCFDRNAKDFSGTGFSAFFGEGFHIEYILKGGW